MDFACSGCTSRDCQHGGLLEGGAVMGYAVVGVRGGWAIGFPGRICGDLFHWGKGLCYLDT